MARSAATCRVKTLVDGKKSAFLTSIKPVLGRLVVAGTLEITILYFGEGQRGATQWHSDTPRVALPATAKAGPPEGRLFQGTTQTGKF